MDHEPTACDRHIAAAVHASIFIGDVVPPALTYLWPGRSRPFVRRHSAEAFDFQLTWAIVFISSCLVMLLLDVGGLLTIVAWEGSVFLRIGYGFRAAVRAWRGRDPGYPPSLRMLRRRSDRREPRPFLTPGRPGPR